MHCQSVGIVPVFPRQQHGLPLGFSPKTADKLHTTFPDSGLESLPENSKLSFQANNYFPYDSITVTIVKWLTQHCGRHSLCNSTSYTSSHLHINSLTNLARGGISRKEPKHLACIWIKPWRLPVHTQKIWK